MAVIIDNDL